MPHHLHTAPLPAPTPAPLDPFMEHLNLEALWLGIILIWTLVGLWAYLDSKGYGQRADWVMTLIGGPGAWLVAFWDVTHRRVFPKKPVVTKQQWEVPDRWN